MTTLKGKRVLLTGATGFIGQALTLRLARQGAYVSALVRDLKKASHLPCEKIRWDGVSAIEGLGDLEKFDAVIHLAGESIASQRWSDQVKKKLRDSRVTSTRRMVEALSTLPSSKIPSVFLSGSAIGYYGERGDQELFEGSAQGAGFLADLCADWELEALKANALEIRTVLLRTGIVLGRDGGALEKMKPATLGDGEQWMSWIHLDDVLGLIEFAIKNEDVLGAINLVAPSPVKNKDFAQILSKVTNSYQLPSVPAFAIKAALGEMSQFVLSSQRVFSRVASELGYVFQFSSLERALDDLFAIKPPYEKGDEEFLAFQFISRPLNEVFSFFSQAENLETITPPFLGFKVLSKSTPEIEEGTLIDYKLKIHGVPARWRTRIESWNKNQRFVDTQLIGPYSKWHHTHTFEEVPGGTLMCDRVVYRLPAGKLGRLVAGAFVKNDVKNIFEFRRSKILEVFS